MKKGNRDATQSRLSAAYLRGLSPALAAGAAAWPGDLGASLALLWRRGETAWPSLAIDAAGWMGFLAGHLKGDEAARGFPAFEHAEDLFLAYACLTGVPGALRAFEEIHFAKLPSVLARLSTASDFVSDVGQELRSRLFVGGPDAAGLAAYTGRGSLGAWFRVTAVNTALNLLKKLGPAGISGGGLDAATAGADAAAPVDPETRLVRERTKAEMQEIIRQVLAHSPRHERALLRMHFVNGSTLDELAKIFKVHRATIARWIRGARQSVLHETQRRMIEKLRLSPSVLSSTLRMSRAEWTLNLESVLRDGA